MKRLELFIEGIVLASRWLLVIFYIGLGIALDPAKLPTKLSVAAH